MSGAENKIGEAARESEAGRWVVTQKAECDPSRVIVQSPDGQRSDIYPKTARELGALDPQGILEGFKKK